MRIMPEQTSVVRDTDVDGEHEHAAPTRDHEDAAPARDREDGAPTQPTAEELVVEDLLVEDVSIDGMCGVY